MGKQVLGRYMERAQAIGLRSPESLTTHIQQGIKNSSCLKKMKACHFSFFFGRSMENKFPSLSPRKKHCFQMSQPPLVTEQKNCRAKPTPKVSKQLFEKLLRFEGKRASPAALVVKNSPANAGDLRDPCSIPGSGRFPREGLSNPLQYSCLENPLDRGAWWATVHDSQSQTQLKQLTTEYTHLTCNTSVLICTFLVLNTPWKVLITFGCFQFSSVQSLSCVQLFANP